MDSERALISALEAELEAAARAAADLATSHQAEIDQLQGDVAEAKGALLAVQESLSWRVTVPLRMVARLLGARGRRG